MNARLTEAMFHLHNKGILEYRDSHKHYRLFNRNDHWTMTLTESEINELLGAGAIIKVPSKWHTTYKAAPNA